MAHVIRCDGCKTEIDYDRVVDPPAMYKLTIRFGSTAIEYDSCSQACAEKLVKSLSETWSKDVQDLIRQIRMRQEGLDKAKACADTHG